VFGYDGFVRHGQSRCVLDLSVAALKEEGKRN
jgi:hypothetical protein